MIDHQLSLHRKGFLPLLPEVPGIIVINEKMTGYILEMEEIDRHYAVMKGILDSQFQGIETDHQFQRST